jgi:hypothetical protein
LPVFAIKICLHYKCDLFLALIYEFYKEAYKEYKEAFHKRGRLTILLYVQNIPGLPLSGRSFLLLNAQTSCPSAKN